MFVDIQQAFDSIKKQKQIAALMNMEIVPKLNESNKNNSEN